MNLILLAEELERDEGLRLFPYRDTVGKLTIGVGRNLDDTGISRTEAVTLLADDISRTEAALVRALPWVTRLDDVRLRVLMNMAFNLGVRGLLKFVATLAAVEQGEWAVAARGMRDSKWARQVGARATRLSEMMLTGSVPRAQATPRSVYQRRTRKRATR